MEGQERLDRWMRESVVDIVRSLREASLLVQVYAGSASRSSEKKVVVDLEAVKERWESGESPLPEGVIFVEELEGDASLSHGFLAPSASLISSNPNILSSPKFPFTRPSLSFPSSSISLSKPLRTSSFSLNRSSLFLNTCLVRASRELPLVGNTAPDFEAEAVFDQEFVKVKLSKYIGKKYVVLFFYPLDFTFVCPTEITAFSDRHAEFEELNTEILGVSVDSVFSHLAWVQTNRKSGGLGDLKYPLISDITKSISKSYGVLIPDQGIALRGLFIIDKQGVIQHSTINNLAIGRSVDETKRTLQALQYVQDNPDEVCPAGWTPGEKSMKPDPKLSKEYFGAV
ncbi:hypothetical protein Fmac_006569 [Flemingia macrophylla]|uniref:thioredoxin-dependent peroxiredoxin n=1 Tax=Flemingia macrophylla TaxID=520843 RepID=A0ABD1NB22_9FABA